MTKKTSEWESCRQAEVASSRAGASRTIAELASALHLKQFAGEASFDDDADDNNDNNNNNNEPLQAACGNRKRKRRKKKKHRREPSEEVACVGCCQASRVVPYYCVKLVLVFHLIILIGSLSAAAGSEPAANRTKQLPRARPLPAETIVLGDGSTTFVSSLEEFLETQTEPSGEPLSSSSPNPRLEREGSPQGRNWPHLEAKNSTSLASASQSAQLIMLPALPTHQTIKLNELQSRPNQSLGDGPSVHSPAGGQHQHERPEHQHQHQHQPHHHQGGHLASNGTHPKAIPQHSQVKSLLNVTQDCPLAYSQIICGYIWPLMAALTLFTNLMIVFVLTQRDMRTPTNVVLTAIAIADIIPIVVPVPWFVYLFAMGYEKQILYPPVACYFYQHSTRSVSEVFYFLSTWLNVLLAIQDYLTACRPKLAKKYCQIRVVIVEIVSLTLLAFLLNLPQALKSVFKPVQFYYNGELTWGCKAMQAKWFKDLVGEGAALYDDIITAISVLFVDGGPAVLLITLTVLLIRQLKRQRIKGHLLMEQARTASKRRRERHRQQEYEASARVMIYVLLAFLAIKIPFATIYSLMIIQSRFDIHFVENLVDFQKAISLTDMVFVLSYPLNFTIFCCCSKKFRHKCAQLLSECDRSKRSKDRLMSDASRATSASFMARHFSQQQDELSQSRTSSRQSSFLGNLAAGKRSSLIPNLTNRMKDCDQLTILEEASSAQHEEDLNQNGPLQAVATIPEQPAADSSRVQLRPRELGPNSKALLEDGSLCFECIVRYERLKKSLTSSSPRETNEAASDWSVANRTVTSQSSENSFVVCPTPSLNSIGLLQSQMPHIITTRCESICECQSSEDTSGASETNNKQLKQSTGRSSPEELAESELEGTPDKLSLGAGDAIGEEPTEKGQRLQRHESRRDGHLRSPTKVNSGNRVCSDPGVGGKLTDSLSQFPGILISHHASNDNLGRNLSHEQCIAAQSEVEKEEEEAEAANRKEASCELSPTLSQAEGKRRSLSLSNSNLSTLPQATGMLADMFVSVLFNVNSPQGSRGSSKIKRR